MRIKKELNRKEDNMERVEGMKLKRGVEQKLNFADEIKLKKALKKEEKILRDFEHSYPEDLMFLDDKLNA
jgi:hypothetical protein